MIPLSFAEEIYLLAIDEDSGKVGISYKISIFEAFWLVRC
jgi:hypothetical protein